MNYIFIDNIINKYIMSSSFIKITNELNINKITFGKYKDKTFDYVLSNDNNYCKWILTQNSNIENMKTFKQYIQNNINIIHPPKGIINVTELCRYYYCNNQILELFNNLIIEKKR